MISNIPPWPNGAKCAVAFSFDVDADSVVHAGHRRAAVDKIHALAHMRYDPFVALPRLAKMFGSFNIPVTWFMPGWVIETYRHEVDVVLNYSHEVAHHGFYHEWPNEQSREEERDTLQRGIETIRNMTGIAPVGYRAPYYGLSKNSFDLLIEAGFEYDSSLFADDIPIILDNGKGTLVELSIPATVDDYNQYVSSRAFDYLMKISSPQTALEVYKADFDAMWEFGGMWIGVWHPAVSGRPAQALAIRQLIEHMQAKGDVWFATHAEIASHVKALVENQVWRPRREKIPFYTKPVLG